MLASTKNVAYWGKWLAYIRGKCFKPQKHSEKIHHKNASLQKKMLA
jgi:hypothetical protein